MTKGLDLLLINVGGTRKRIYQGLARDFSGIEPPSWVALTAGFTRKEGYEVNALDANALNLDYQETVEEIERQNPRFTGIIVYGQQANTSTPTMTGVGELARKIKENNPERKLVISGWHPSALPERTLREEACDFVAEGEGFYTYQGLLEGRGLKDIPGLWWREGKEIAHTDRARNVENLTQELSEIAWDLLPMNRYRSYNWHGLADLDNRTKYASMFTRFGCPFQCNFCAIHATFGEKRMRDWDPQWVLKQIDHLVKTYDVKNLKINDELFVFHPEHFMPIIDGLIEREYGLNIAAFARVDATKPAYLEKLKKAGVNWLELGIESASRAVLDAATKGKYGAVDIRKKVRQIHNAGIDLCANFVFGLPKDTRQSMQETLDLAMELQPAFPSFFAAMAPPGSDLYNDALKKGIRLPDQWVGYAQQGY
jgi:anaerobic magnesium-protoporphyrin IX monomethyl ester cyclase